MTLAQPPLSGDRSLPSPDYSENAEQAVLSAMLMDGEAVLRAFRSVDESMFYSTANRRIFCALVSLSERGDTIDPITLSEELSRSGELGAAGGEDYLGYLVDAVPTAANIEYHARIVREKAGRRRAKEINVMAGRLLTDGTPVTDVVLWQREALAGVALQYGMSEGKRSELPVYDDEELVNLPAPSWDVPGVIPRNGLVQIHGPYASGKTFAALDIVFHRSLGLPWHGIELEQGLCFYVLAEGAAGARVRVAGIKKYYGVTRAGIYFIPQPVHLNNEAEVAELIAAIKERASEGAKPWVVIDTRSRCFIGNENSTEDVSAFVRGCDRIRQETDATVIVLHHPGWGTDERGRGAYDFDASCDTIIRVEKDAERITLSCTKQKDGPNFSPLAFETFPFAQTLLLRAVELSAGKLTGQRLTALRSLHDNSTDLGCTYSSWLAGSGLKSSSFNKAREWLKTEGYVKTSAGKWKLTEAGQLAMRSTDATDAPPSLHSEGDNSASSNCTHTGGFTPVVVERASRQATMELEAPAPLNREHPE